MTTIIVGCGSRKQSKPAPALWLYTSGIRQWYRRWSLSVTTPDHIWVLSAKYGLIPSTQVIEPYNATFSPQRRGYNTANGPLSPPISPTVTATQIRDAGLSGEIIMLAGAPYYAHMKATGANLDLWNPFAQGPNNKAGWQMKRIRHSLGVIPERIRP